VRGEKPLSVVDLRGVATCIRDGCVRAGSVVRRGWCVDIHGGSRVVCPVWSVDFHGSVTSVHGGFVERRDSCVHLRVDAADAPGKLSAARLRQAREHAQHVGQGDGRGGRFGAARERGTR
jgi:hypothetical protein